MAIDIQALMAETDRMAQAKEPSPEPQASEQYLNIPIHLLDDFERSRSNRYRLHRGQKHDALLESIRIHGIITPLLVRSKGYRYEVISGRNRREIARELSYTSVPCIVRSMDDTDALAELHEDNRQFRDLTISEKAFAYAADLQLRIKYTQGWRSDLSTSCTYGTKLNSTQALADEEDESRRNIYRYIKLTELKADGFFDAVDANLLPMLAALELTQLNEQQQFTVYDYFYKASPGWDGGLEISPRSDAALIVRVASDIVSAVKAGKSLTSELLDELCSSAQPVTKGIKVLKLGKLTKRFPCFVK